MNNLSEGLYGATLHAWSTRETGKGTPFVGIDVTIVNRIENGEISETVDPPLARTVKLFLSPAAMEFSETQLRLLKFNGDFGEGMDFGAEAKADGVTLRLSYRETDSGTYENWNVVEPDRRAANSVIDNLNRDWAARNSAKPDVPHAETAGVSSGNIPF